MTRFNHCRFCDDWRDQNLVRYSTRHLAHFKCYLDAGKKLEDLRPWQIRQFPYFLLKERGLLETAEALSKEQNDQPYDYYVDDFAFDAAREDRVFGRRR